jgi:hypothetical protein
VVLPSDAPTVVASIALPDVAVHPKGDVSVNVPVSLV